MAKGKAGQSLDGDEAAPLRARVVGERAEYQAVVDQANATLRDLRAQLRREQEARIAAQVELDNLKKGSIAMMKYVTNLQRKKHDEELAALKGNARTSRREGKELEDQVEALLKEVMDAGGGAAVFNPEKTAPEEALRRREAAVAARERQLEERIQRLREERELKRQEAGSKFEQEMGRLPEMQKLVIDRDDTIKALRKELEKRDEELYFKVAELAARVQAGDGIDPRFSKETADGIQTVLVRLRHELKQKDEELARQAADFQVKMRNTIALIRIKYEKELAEVSPPKGWRAKRGGKRG